MTQSYGGRLRYLTDHQEGLHRLLVTVPCLIGGGAAYVHALLDTASEWCILSAELATEVTTGPDPQRWSMRLHTRFGMMEGHLERIPVRFHALEGDSLETEATWFISSDWPGPTVIGWRGCLERLRTGLNPADDSFLFGEL